MGVYRGISFLLFVYILSVPVASVAENLIVNGDFDSGPGSPWYEYDAGMGYPLIVSQPTSPLPPHTGDFLTWLGGIPDGLLYVSQQIYIPERATDLQLTGYLWLINNGGGAAAWDFLDIEILTPEGAVLELIAEWSNLDQTTSWVPFTLDIAGNYAGTNVQLRLSSWNDSTFETSFFIDSLSLHPSPSSGIGETGQAASRFVLNAAPNPFNPSTTVSYAIPEAGHVDLSIYDISGRLIKTLVDTHMSAGQKTAEWNGTDSTGKRVASGTYFLRLEKDQGVRTRKVMLAK